MIDIAESVLYIHFKGEDDTIFAKDAVNADGFVNGVRITGRGELTISRDTTYVDSGPGSEVDPDWWHVDTAGHFHARDKKGDTPTLIWKHSGPYWCEDCNDKHTDDWQVCLVCGETIKPGYRSTPSSRLPMTTTQTMSLSFSLFNWKNEDLARLGMTQGSGLQELVSLYISGDGIDWFGFVRLGPLELSGKEEPRIDCTAVGRLHSRR